MSMTDEINKLREILAYDAHTGELTWKTDVKYSRAKAGEKPKYTIDKDGYMRLKANRKVHIAHRVAWMIVNGEIPHDMQIDHVNHDRTDNRLENLRLVSNKGNQRNRSLNKNNKTGLCGVRRRWKNSYIADIRVNGKKISLGSFDNIFDAACARISAQNKYNFHKNHGRTL
jgi:hypothetical protein